MNDEPEIPELAEDNSKKQRKRGSSMPPNAGIGRPKGVPNKLTADVKEMVMGALDELGGQAWLASVAKKNPIAFLALLSRLIPTRLHADLTVTSNLAERLVMAERQAFDN